MRLIWRVLSNNPRPKSSTLATMAPSWNASRRWVNSGERSSWRLLQQQEKERERDARFSYPALLLTHVNCLAPESRSAAMRFSGVPQRPKPA